VSTRTLAVGADTLWLEDTGGAGVPLVLLHPGITDSEVWDRMMPLLGGQRVIRFDRRGFGRSPVATEAFRPVDDLVAVLDACGVDRAHLLGNSMGGETSLALAVSAPERIASMTLLCPGIGGYPWPEPTPAALELYERYKVAHEAGDIDAMAALALEEWCASGADDYLRTQLRATTEADLAQAELEQPNPEQWEALPSLAIPTTVVAGDLDPPDSLQASLDLAGRIPDAALVRLDTDHLPQYRDPDAVAAVVQDTVARGGA
jgi:3-oxoadipate enol-lactonase